MATWMQTTRELEAHGPSSFQTFPAGTPVILIYSWKEVCDVEFPGGRTMRIGTGDVEKWRGQP